MALTKLPPPPAPQQKVDDERGVFFSWHEWFTRLWAFVNSLYDMILAIDTSSTVVEGGMVPYYIAPAEEFIVPVYKQALFEMTIDNEGILTVDGFLIQVT